MHSMRSGQEDISIYIRLVHHHIMHYVYYHDPKWPDDIFTGRATRIHYNDLYIHVCMCVFDVFRSVDTLKLRE